MLSGKNSVFIIFSSFVLVSDVRGKFCVNIVYNPLLGYNIIVINTD